MINDRDLAICHLATSTRHSTKIDQRSEDQRWLKAATFISTTSQVK